MAPLRCPACESPVIHQRFAKHRFGGIHVCCAVQKFPPQFDACNGARGFDAAERRPSLHSRAGASLQPGRVSALRRGDSGCRARQSLHDQEQIAIDAGMPGVLQTRTEATVVAAGRPLSIRPANARKPAGAKPSRSKNLRSRARPDSAMGPQRTVPPLFGLGLFAQAPAASLQGQCSER